MTSGQNHSTGFFNARWFGNTTSSSEPDDNPWGQPFNSINTEAPPQPPHRAEGAFNVFLNMMFPKPQESNDQDTKSDKGGKKDSSTSMTSDATTNDLFEQNMKSCSDFIDDHVKSDVHSGKSRVKRTESLNCNQLLVIILGASMNSSELRCRVQRWATEAGAELSEDDSLMLRVLPLKHEALSQIVAKIIRTDNTPSTQDIIHCATVRFETLNYVAKGIF
ncbi:uncharacterized protein GGS22DRAFT_184965 [Annulohypoxylon maeteangense]|uniref:uncharacterized protein n=1 Tax=Annulohypoxylon maeteangense TaxID=1927788 RepID=UPI002007B212|nr:uncharacterized protein GGS22DRAFT_184965 [Annulohypoxylon maeteangense]KAI0889387.1 hypothetical protein GGS22DRAFT_184965 [Annulohypoxylon maeteangense]